jgi:hypothetical protein
MGDGRFLGTEQRKRQGDNTNHLSMAEPQENECRKAECADRQRPGSAVCKYHGGGHAPYIASLHDRYTSRSY